MKAMAIGCLKTTFIILFAIMIYFLGINILYKIIQNIFNLGLSFQTTPPCISIEVLE
jgi:hypothetical protein